MESAAILVPVQLATAKARFKNFSKEDQVDFCHAWLEVSEDPLIGDDQSSAGFWAKFADVCKKMLWEIQAVVTALVKETYWTTGGGSRDLFSKTAAGPPVT